MSSCERIEKMFTVGGAYFLIGFFVLCYTNLKMRFPQVYVSLPAFTIYILDKFFRKT